MLTALKIMGVLVVALAVADGVLRAFGVDLV